ncbi:DUF559 domain-containing protein [Microbacterium sp.]|uniref:DUF559 domain-containing protein n=1 Tax=Microbacterium sp. TaxID=51671 RepID=UPI0039E2A296
MRTTADLEHTLHARGGAVHSADLRAAGYSPHAMRLAIAAGRAERVRRSWLVAPTCDPQVRAAAAVGGRLTCITEAERRGLWTPEHSGRLHVAVPSTASRLAADGMVLHWAPGPAPMGGHALVDGLVNVLFHVAGCLEPADALAVWESALRKRMVDPDVLRRVQWRSTAATRYASVASSLSDSGLETRFVDLMRSIGVEVQQQKWIDGHPLDGLIGERLGIQLDGFAHHRAADRRRDLRADARLVLRGYTILRFDFYQILFCPEEVIATITMAMAQGLHLAR